MIVGLAAGAFNVLTPPRLTKELLFAVFLPGLVFEAAYNIHVSELRRTWRTVSTLAVPGVIVAIVPTGGAIAWLLGVSPRLTTLVEAESLFNDGTAIVALTLILAFVSGESTSVASLAGDSCWPSSEGRWSAVSCRTSSFA